MECGGSGPQQGVQVFLLQDTGFMQGGVNTGANGHQSVSSSPIMIRRRLNDRRSRGVAPVEFVIPRDKSGPRSDKGHDAPFYPT